MWSNSGHARLALPPGASWAKVIQQKLYIPLALLKFKPGAVTTTFMHTSQARRESQMFSGATL